MINETLEACLQGETRKMHTIYEIEKLSLLYRIILTANTEDVGHVRRKILTLNSEAKNLIDEEEKAQRIQAKAQDDFLELDD